MKRKIGDTSFQLARRATYYHKYRHLGCISILVTFPDQLMIFDPGTNLGKSPLKQLFKEVMPEYASCSSESMVILPEKSDNSVMYWPTMIVTSPEPYTDMVGSEKTVAGFITELIELVSVMGCTFS